MNSTCNETCLLFLIESLIINNPTLLDELNSNSATVYQAVAILAGIVCTVLSTLYANYQNWKTHQVVTDVHSTTKNEIVPMIREASAKNTPTTIISNGNTSLGNTAPGSPQGSSNGS
jgi:hypothetical protein